MEADAHAVSRVSRNQREQFSLGFSASVIDGTLNQATLATWDRKPPQEAIMTEKAIVGRKVSDIKQLDDALRVLYPRKTTREIKEIRSQVIGYVANGLATGHNIALIKGEGGNAKLKVLTLVEQRRRGHLLGSGSTEEK